MTNTINQWIGAYYPNEMISRPRSKATFCLLFDKIICHFPVADMAHGGGHGMSDFYGDEVLVKSGVVEFRERILVPEIDPIPSAESCWGTDEKFNQFLKLQTTFMALNTCTNDFAVPVTDDLNWPVPCSFIRNIDFPHFAHLQASALALQSLDIVIPPISSISDEDILMARDKLGEQLIPFRSSMLKLAPLIRNGIRNDVSFIDIYKEANYIVTTTVAPTLTALKARLLKEKGRFWRRLVLKTSTVIPKLVVNWVTKNALIALAEGLFDSKDLILEAFTRDKWSNSMNLGGVGFLLSVENYTRLKWKK